jgi:hypothetical protein
MQVRRVSATLVLPIVIALLLGLAASGVAIAHTCSSPVQEGMFFEHEELDGDYFHWCFGESYANLSNQGWNDRIDSLRLTLSIGKGVILYKDAGYSGGSWKICGSTVRLEMPPGWHDVVSSMKSTTTCAQSPAAQ